MSARAGLRVLVALAAAVVGAGSFALFRPGYSPDEEFTLFAVRGIAAHGLPLLPSGLLYDRGLLFSYLCWVAAVSTGLELSAFRGLGLVSAAATLIGGYGVLRRVASPPAGVAAALLVALCVPFWSVATTGRFYAPFLLSSVGILLVLARWLIPAPVLVGPVIAASVAPLAPVALLFVLSLLSRLTHELAFTLVAIPAAGLTLVWIERRKANRAVLRRWLTIGAAMAAGLVVAQVLLMALHYVQPGDASSGTMIRRFFLWQVLNLFERPHGGPVGLVCAAVVVAWLLVPARAAVALIAGAAASVAVVASAMAHAARTVSPADPALLRLIAGSTAYPLDMFWSLASANPVMVWGALLLLVARLGGSGGEWPAGERAVHLAWVGWVLWFGVIESGITLNYQLLPTVCLLAAIGVDLVAIGQQAAAVWPGRRAQMTRAALTGAALLVVADQWSGAGPLPARLAAARPTISVPGMGAIRRDLRPEDRVACTDELACLLLVGRVDAWLALDDYVRERFVVDRGAGPVGVYAGAPAVFTLGELFERVGAGGAASRVIVVDVFKEYPVGDSAEWLPRALRAEHAEGETLLVTPQARVIDVRKAEPGARN